MAAVLAMPHPELGHTIGLRRTARPLLRLLALFLGQLFRNGRALRCRKRTLIEVFQSRFHLFHHTLARRLQCVGKGVQFIFLAPEGDLYVVAHINLLWRAASPGTPGCGPGHNPQ